MGKEVRLIIRKTITIKTKENNEKQKTQFERRKERERRVEIHTLKK